MERPQTNPKMVIYLVGALKNLNIPVVANTLRKALGKDVEVFSSWFHCGPKADLWNWKCCKERGLDYREMLLEWGSQNAYKFDRKHLLRADVVIGLFKVGRSGHLELGFSVGRGGKRVYMLFPDGPPDRPDIMYALLANVFFSIEELTKQLKLDYKFFSKKKNKRKLLLN